MCSGKFALQIADLTDISGHAQLLANVCFLDENIIIDFFLFCKALHTKRKSHIRV